LPVCDIDDHAVIDARADAGAGGLGGICVGQPLPEREVRIVRISDAPLPAGTRLDDIGNGQVGEIAVRGPVVTREYFNLPDATRAAKTVDDCGQLWHRMGDVGYRDARGRIWYCGRKSHRVVTAGGTLFTEPCEAVFNAHPAVARCALVGVGACGKVEPVICVELKTRSRGRTPHHLAHELRTLAERAAHTRSIRTFLIYPRAFPVDVRHNAKIRREELATWAARQLR